MSLDVYLALEGHYSEGSGIYVREDGRVKEISRQEWDDRFPGREPYVADRLRGEVYSANITHNLSPMAKAAGLYDYLWTPESLDIENAKALIEPLRTGLAELRADPEKFKAFNPSNGWGDYEGLVTFTADYLAACERFPLAKVEAWR